MYKNVGDTVYFRIHPMGKISEGIVVHREQGFLSFGITSAEKHPYYHFVKVKTNDDIEYISVTDFNEASKEDYLKQIAEKKILDDIEKLEGKLRILKENK